MFLFISKTMLEVGWSVILWSMLYLEGLSSRSNYFIGVALQQPILLMSVFCQQINGIPCFILQQFSTIELHQQKIAITQT